MPYDAESWAQLQRMRAKFEHQLRVVRDSVQRKCSSDDLESLTKMVRAISAQLD
jgi:hypothetical protein